MCKFTVDTSSLVSKKLLRVYACVCVYRVCVLYVFVFLNKCVLCVGVCVCEPVCVCESVRVCIDFLY